MRNASDQCAGTIQWVDPVHGCMGVDWDDGTTSTERTGDHRGWELLSVLGHACGRRGCACPGCGGPLWYSHQWREHACQRVDCGYANGPGQGGGWALPWPEDPGALTG